MRLCPKTLVAVLFIMSEVLPLEGHTIIRHYTTLMIIALLGPDNPLYKPEYIPLNTGSHKIWTTAKSKFDIRAVSMMGKKISGRYHTDYFNSYWKEHSASFDSTFLLKYWNEFRHGL